MNYIFTGNSEFLISDAIKKWKNQFIEKYGEFNFSHLKDIQGLEQNLLRENILSESFLSEKKLIILDLNNDFTQDFEEFLLKTIEKKAENNILIFNYFSPDKRKKFFKELKKICKIKEFNEKDESDIKKIINYKYSGKIEDKAINLIIKYKANNTKKIISELEKLFITKDFIKKDDIEKNILPELEESIFQVIDLLLNKDKVTAIEKINIILNDTNIFAFYNNLLANLRTNLFIMNLKNKKLSYQEISKTLDLGNRSFLVNKNYKITFKELKDLYVNLIEIDKRMKTGKLLSSEEKDIFFEIEKCILL